MAIDLKTWGLPRVTRGGLRVEPMTADHEVALTKAASDPRIWEGHPVKDRYKPEVFKPYFDFLLDAGSAVVVSAVDVDEVVGCSRYYPVPDAPDDVGIGFTFLRCDQWGGAANFTFKSIMLDHAFNSFDTVWFHIDPTNFRSQAATAKIGVEYRYDAEFALGPSVAQWKCYSINRAQWAARCATQDR